MDKRIITIGSAVGLILAIAALLFFAWQSVTSTVELKIEFESNGFRMSYPDGWQHKIPETNMLFLSSPETLRLEAGASLVVQRSLRLTTQTDSLEEALNVYLEQGALRNEGKWAIVSEIEQITFAKREAIQIALEGSEVEDAPIMRSEIIVTRADNNIVYIFSVSAPLETWQQDEKILDAILGSVEILE